MKKFVKPTKSTVHFDEILNNLPLRKEYFSKEALEACSQGVLTIDELNLLLKMEVITAHNQLVSDLRVTEADLGIVVYDRALVLDNLCKQKRIHLKSFVLELVSISSLGYAFETRYIKEDEDARNLWIDVVFRKGISIWNPLYEL